MKKTLYIAYGSNMNLEQMSHRCPTARVLGTAMLDGYRLLFRGNNGGAVATVEKEQGSSVPVLVLEITPTDEAALDRYEGYPYLYRKETVRVRFDGKMRSVMVYIMNDCRSIGIPSRYYYETILQGYRTAELDQTTLKEAVRLCRKEALENE